MCRFSGRTGRSAGPRTTAASDDSLPDVLRKVQRHEQPRPRALQPLLRHAPEPKRRRRSYLAPPRVTNGRMKPATRQDHSQHAAAGRRRRDDRPRLPAGARAGRPRPGDGLVADDQAHRHRVPRGRHDRLGRSAHLLRAARPLPRADRAGLDPRPLRRPRAHHQLDHRHRHRDRAGDRRRHLPGTDRVDHLQPQNRRPPLLRRPGRRALVGLLVRRRVHACPERDLRDLRRPPVLEAPPAPTPGHAGHGDPGRAGRAGPGPHGACRGRGRRTDRRRRGGGGRLEHRQVAGAGRSSSC